MWVNPSRQLSTSQPLAYPLLHTGKGNKIRKVKDLIDSDKGSLVGKPKAVPTHKAKQGIHSLHPIRRQMFSLSGRAALHHA